VDPSIDMVQSKILIDLLLRGLLEDERKINPYIFLVILETKLKGLFFRPHWEIFF
jgi:hypothetical protein